MSSLLNAQTALLQTEHRLSPEDQKTRIVSVDHYQDLFNDAYLNNFSIVCPNKRYQNDLLIESKKGRLYKLNRAAYNLWVFSGMCLEKVKEMEDFQPDSNLLAKLSGTVREWGDHLQAGNAFLTFDMAKEIIDTLRQLDFPFDDLLGNQTYSVIKAAFIQLHYQAKAFVKIDVFIKREEVYAVLQRLIDALYEHPLLFYYLEGLEMAKESFSGGRVSELREEEYPAVSIFPDSSIVTTHRNPLVGEILRLITSITKDFSPLNPDTAYCFLAETNVTLCQGYRNYKRYLELLGLLEEVYDRDLNYAFINNRL
jgi:hypothetical protein